MRTAPPRLCDTGDMVVVHRVFRREFGLLPALVRATPPGDVRQAAEVTDHARHLTEALQDHHHNEDALLWPKLADRAPVDLELVERMAEQHRLLGALLDQMLSLLPGWRRTADVGLGVRLAAALGDLSTALDEHLADEETHLLPLAGQHITQPEWTELGERAIAGMSRPRLLLFLGYVLEDVTPAERAMMLAKLPPPARVAYRVVGARKARRTTARLRRGVSAPGVPA